MCTVLSTDVYFSILISASLSSGFMVENMLTSFELSGEVVHFLGHTYSWFGDASGIRYSPLSTSNSTSTILL